MLGVLGGLITLVAGLASWAGTQGLWFWNFLGPNAAMVGVVVGILTLIFAFMGGKSKAVWALWLIFSLIGLAAGAGVVIGPLLALIGSVWALKQK